MAKKTGPRPTVKSSAKTKKNATPKSSIRVVEADSLKRVRKNTESYYATVKAKSGATAREKAAEVMRENKGRPKKVIKIRSGGGMAGGMFGIKNR